MSRRCLSAAVVSAAVLYSSLASLAQCPSGQCPPGASSPGGRGGGGFGRIVPQGIGRDRGTEGYTTIPQGQGRSVGGRRHVPQVGFRRAVVRIQNRQRSGLVVGSGCWLEFRGCRLVLTAAHIFSDGAGEITVGQPRGISSRASLVAVDETWDIAILTCETEPADATAQLRCPRSDGELLSPGEQIEACGFGMRGEFGSSSGVFTQFVLPGDASGRQVSDIPDLLEMAAVAEQGDSGGPIFDTEGRVVGIIKGTDRRAATNGVQSGRIASFLSGMVDSGRLFPWRQRPQAGGEKPSTTPPPATPSTSPVPPVASTPVGPESSADRVLETMQSDWWLDGVAALVIAALAGTAIGKKRIYLWVAKFVIPRVIHSAGPSIVKKIEGWLATDHDDPEVVAAKETIARKASASVKRARRRQADAADMQNEEVPSV